MADLVDRQALHYELTVEMVKCARMSEETKWTMAERVLNRLDEAPTIDPASLRPKGEWISIEDRLPEYGQYVIVYTGRMMEGSVGAMYFWHEAYDIWQPVSHWMPLPEPPNMRGSV